MERNSEEVSTPAGKLSMIEEQLDVRVQENVTGVVRLDKIVRTRDALVNQELLRDSVVIERVAVNRQIDSPADTRYEGDTTILPVMEEVVVISKRLILKEEIRITRRTDVARHEETVPLRSEEIHIERR